MQSIFLRFVQRRAPLPSLGTALLAAAFMLSSPLAALAQSGAPPLVVDDFESYTPGSVPSQWKYIERNKEAVSLKEKTNDTEHTRVRREEGDNFARAFTDGESLRITQRNGKEFDWSLDERPYLQWRWRANKLPEGASEKDKNDTGGAVYVTFGSDWLGRPKSIKYTYSSSLPVGTVVDFGPLKAMVVASAEEGIGNWRTETRDVAQDIRNLFGNTPPDEPLSITLWSDSDTTGGVAEVDFDDIRLLADL